MKLPKVTRPCPTRVLATIASITNEAGYLYASAPGDSKAIHTSQADAQVPLQLHYYSFIIQLLFFYFKCSRRDFTKHFGVVSDIDECQDKVTYPYAGIFKNTVGVIIVHARREKV